MRVATFRILRRRKLIERLSAQARLKFVALGNPLLKSFRILLIEE